MKTEEDKVHSIQAAKLPLVSKNVKNTSKSVVRWNFKKFKNPARSDSLQLKHWDRVGNVKEFVFAELNVKNDVIMYTKEEYDLLIEKMDRLWTRQDTDELFALCNQFGCRFQVILDRFSNKEKTMDDIKKRYYSIAKAVADYRGKYLKQSEYLDHPVVKTTFDYEGSVRRRKMMDNEWNRSEEDEKMEIFVRERLAKIQEMRIERDRVSNTKRKRDVEFLESYDQPEDNPDRIRELIFPNMANLRSGVHSISAQYTKQFTSSETLNRRVDMLMNEYGISTPMMTENVLIQNEILRQKILQLIDLQKKVSKKESTLLFGGDG